MSPSRGDTARLLSALSFSAQKHRLQRRKDAEGSPYINHPIKELQVKKVAGLSPGAKMIRIADKICNVRDVSHSPPTHWGTTRRREYFDWTERVVAGCRGANEMLERLFFEVLRQGREPLAKSL